VLLLLFFLLLVLLLLLLYFLPSFLPSRRPLPFPFSCPAVWRRVLPSFRPSRIATRPSSLHPPGEHDSPPRILSISRLQERCPLEVGGSRGFLSTLTKTSPRCPILIRALIRREEREREIRALLFREGREVLPLPLSSLPLRRVSVVAVVVLDRHRQNKPTV